MVEEGRLGGEDHPSTAPSPRCRQLCAVDRAASRENLLLHAEKRAGIREYPASWRKRIIQEIPSFLIRDTVIAFNSFRFGWKTEESRIKIRGTIIKMLQSRLKTYEITLSKPRRKFSVEIFVSRCKIKSLPLLLHQEKLVCSSPPFRFFFFFFSSRFRFWRGASAQKRMSNLVN